MSDKKNINVGPMSKIPEYSGDLAIQVADQIPGMLAYWDKDLKCRFANEAYIEWFGKNRDELVNKLYIRELLGENLFEKNLTYIKGVLAGNKQLFEREIPIPNTNTTKHTLATYIPDIKDGEVLGFYVQVTDVTYLKELEKEVALAKKVTQQKLIAMEEIAKRNLVEILRENINQKLIACRLLVERGQKKGDEISLQKALSSTISEIIKELNFLCDDLSPTEIEILGLIESVELFLAKMCKRHNRNYTLVAESVCIEKIILRDKYSIYRIIQNFINLTYKQECIKNVEISIEYTGTAVKIKFVCCAKLVLNKSSNEYHSIISRVDNNNGTITALENEYQIELSVTNM